MDPLLEKDQASEPLRNVAEAAPEYLAELDTRLVDDGKARALLAGLGGPLPEHGIGSVDAVTDLLRVGTATATHSSGPRFFHFVMGGATPAAMAGDWLTSLLDQNAGLWTASPLATTAETVALRWLKEMFGLPASWGGVLTPSATFANLTGLACARHWWASWHGVNVAEEGLHLPAMPVLSGGYVHPSVRKALKLEREVASLTQPAVILASAGEVNAGDFDPIDKLADIAAAYGCWLHVDGAFGLFAALSPKTAPLLDGVDLGETFGSWNAPYLLPVDESTVDHNCLGPESSRRSRALPILATLRAYGRSGYQAMVERHLELTEHLGQLVKKAPDLELLAPARFCVVCFRYRPQGMEHGLDELTARLGREILADGRVYTGTTTYRGMTALRPAIVNWRTTTADIELLVSVIRELGERLTR